MFIHVFDLATTKSYWCLCLSLLCTHTTCTKNLQLFFSSQWRQNERDGVSNHQPHDSLPKRLFRRKSKKTSKLRVTGLCEGNSPVTGEFPAKRASNAEMCPFDDVIMELSIISLNPTCDAKRQSIFMWYGLQLEPSISQYMRLSVLM